MARIGFCVASSGYTREERTRRESLFRSFLPDDVAIETLVASGGPEFLDRRENFGEAVAAAERSLRSMPEDNFDLLVSAGALDPGLEELRAAAPVPVVGAGEASMTVAAAIDRPTSIVTVDEHAVAASEVFYDNLRLRPTLASIRSIEMPVRRIVDDFDAARTALTEGVRRAVEEDGAGTIMLGAMTLGTLGLDSELHQRFERPIINPIRAALAKAVDCLRSLP